MYAPHEGCEHDLITLADDDWATIIEDLVKKLHDGGYQKGAIDSDLYFKTASKLAESITKLGSDLSYDDPRNSLAAQFRANLYQFSGAKSLTESQLFNQLLLDDDGRLKSVNQFRQDVEKVHGLYNNQYLTAEHQNAIASAQSADQWLQWNPEDWLEYRTVGDSRVRETHAKLDRLVFQAKDPIWNRIYTPNDWLCRCNVVPGDKPGQQVPKQEAEKLAEAAVTNEIFNNNPGKTGIVFKNVHPYFESLNGIKELQAVRNYGMRKVESIMAEKDLLPQIAHSPTETDFYIWWKDMVKSHPASENSFALKDRMGHQVLFDASPDGKKKTAYFRDRILGDDAHRHEFAKNLVDIVQKPDELWYTQSRKGLTAVYVKYYKDGPYILKASIGDDFIKAESIEKADQNIDSFRKGVLIHKK